MIKAGSADWNTLEEMIRRCGADDVREAVEIIAEDDSDDEDDYGDGLVPPESDTVASGMRICVWTVRIPEDATNPNHPGKNVGHGADLAIDQAREQAPDWCVPCEWSVEFHGVQEGDMVYRVTRTSNAV